MTAAGNEGRLVKPTAQFNGLESKLVLNFWNPIKAENAPKIK
jgi:hypothetical protein